MTYNIRGGLGMDKRRSIARIADAIRASGAQVVCLQEVHQRLPWSRLLDQPRWLGERLGMTFAFQRNISFGVGGFGNAVLARADITGTRSHRLTSTGEQRGLLRVDLNTTVGPLSVFCTHLGLDPEERIVQAREVAAVVNSTAGPKVLCGDFNEDVETAAVQSLLASTGLVDAAAGGPPTFSSSRPVQRIDLILCDPSIGISAASVVRTTASDHLPVIADILPPGAERIERRSDGSDGLSEE